MRIYWDILWKTLNSMSLSSSDVLTDKLIIPKAYAKNMEIIIL